MAGTDYYNVLGVSRNASDDEIRKAYKKLARNNHPDVKPDDKSAAELFQQIQEAYNILSDAEKREQYDRYGHAFQGGARPGPAGGAQFDFNDLFGGQFGGEIDLGNLFGGSGANRRRPSLQPSKGDNIAARIDVSFLVAAAGGNHELTLQSSGKTERLTVRIPAGVSTGSVIRLSGQGHPGQHGGPRGDLLVTIAVAPHPYFRREANNLYVDLPVTVSEAALGAKIDVPTLTEGRIVVTVPAGTSSGTKLRLRGKGVPDQKTSQPGDQFTVVKIVVPQDLDERSRELFEELARSAPQSPRENLW